jgi:hypothetical protein
MFCGKVVDFTAVSALEKDFKKVPLHHRFKMMMDE